MITFLLTYLLTTGYIWLIALVPVLIIRYLAKDQIVKNSLNVAAAICLSLPITTRLVQQADDNSLKKKVAEHAMEFGRFCGDGPVSPIINSPAPIEGVAVITVQNSVTEAARFRTATAIADVLRGQLICKVRTSLLIQDGSQGSTHELCPVKEKNSTTQSSRTEYQLVFEKVAERVSEAYGKNLMTKVAVQIRHKGVVLGEDNFYFSSQLPMGTRESCPYPEQRLAELLTSAFQLIEFSQVLEQK